MLAWAAQSTCDCPIPGGTESWIGVVCSLVGGNQPMAGLLGLHGL